MKRNLDLGVPPLGARHPAATSLATNVSRTLEEFERWLTTDQISPSLRPILLVAAIAAVGATLVLSVRRSTKLRGEFREMLPLVIVVGLYVGYLIVAASVVAFAAIDFRFLSPIFVPSIILAAWVVERAYRISTHRATRGLIVGAGLAWLAIAVFAFGQHVAAVPCTRCRRLCGGEMAQFETDPGRAEARPDCAHGDQRPGGDRALHGQGCEARASREVLRVVGETSENLGPLCASWSSAVGERSSSGSSTTRATCTRSRNSSSA